MTIASERIALSATELNALAAPIYGGWWQSPLARDMKINVRTVQRWATDGISKPATADAVKRFLDERRRATVAAPPSGTSADDDRDDDCSEAMSPGVMALIAAATEAGWGEAEAITAILANAIDMARQRAGDAATRQTLAAAIQMLDE